MDPVLAALARAGQTGLMPEGATILLAVSGGADSLALLYGCLEAAPAAGWRLSVGHVHHGLRGREADRDLSFVAEHARRNGVPFLSRHRDARREARTLGLSPEAAARRVRYEALAEMARESGADRIAVAHHRGDVAETHLIARGRRGGVASLAGPRQRRSDGVVRPLLTVTRGQILAFLAARGIAYRRDSSNGDLRFERNRARRQLARMDPAEAERLAGVAAKLARERDRLDRQFGELVLPRLHVGPGATVADAAFLTSCPRELARLAVSAAAAGYARPGRPALTGREREQILDRLASGDDFRFEAGRRIRFDRRGAILRVALRPGPVPPGPLRV